MKVRLEGDNPDSDGNPGKAALFPEKHRLASLTNTAAATKQIPAAGEAGGSQAPPPFLVPQAEDRHLCLILFPCYQVGMI